MPGSTQKRWASASVIARMLCNKDISKKYHHPGTLTETQAAWAQKYQDEEVRLATLAKAIRPPPAEATPPQITEDAIAVGAPVTLRAAAALFCVRCPLGDTTMQATKRGPEASRTRHGDPDTDPVTVLPCSTKPPNRYDRAVWK